MKSLSLQYLMYVTIYAKYHSGFSWESPDLKHFFRAPVDM